MHVLLSLLSQWWWLAIPLFLAWVAFNDIVLNKQHTIKHNFPIVGHLRYFLEAIGPELRQYIVANNREELPFNRSQRSWIYASSKKQNNYQGFGTDADIHAPAHVFINPHMFAFQPPDEHINHEDKSFLPCAKVIGESHNRSQPWRPYSVINVSAMSFGSLSGRAISSINKGALISGAFHNCGEGGLSPYHRHGADIVFQIGTAYFGVRDAQGNFSMEKLKQLSDDNPYIRAFELKISQGAKPGKGGVLPASKITKEISKIREIPMGKDVLSPPYHTAFSGVQGMVDFIENIADATGKPVGIKAAIGNLKPWRELAEIMAKTNRGPDYIAIDGGEGGTGAAPLSFAAHMSLPFVYGFAEIYKIFQEFGLSEKIVFIGAGKLGLPSQAMMAFAMGVDLIYVAREAMMSIGCIQAQACHDNSCPTGIATQNKWLEAGINVEDKAKRMNNYMLTMRKEMLELTHATGKEHPAQLTMEDVDLSMGDNGYTETIKNVYGYEKTPVPFDGMNHLWHCDYLGGLRKSESKDAMQKQKYTPYADTYDYQNYDVGKYALSSSANTKQNTIII